MGDVITRKTIISNNLPVVLSRGLRAPGSVWLAKVDVEKAPTHVEAISPLKSIHQRPGSVAKHLHSIDLNSCKTEKCCFFLLFYLHPIFLHPPVVLLP